MTSVKTGSTLLIRTDFTDQEAWRGLSTAVTTPNEDGFVASLHLVDAPAFRGMTAEQIAAQSSPESLIIVADRRALTSPERPLLALYLTEKGTQQLRVIAAQLWNLEQNIFLGTIGWQDFVKAAGPSGVFRGF